MDEKATTLPDFNPSKDPRVDDVKSGIEIMINTVRALEGDARCKSIAITRLEEASMWAVKSLFLK